jgi:hypothetical protein
MERTKSSTVNLKQPMQEIQEWIGISEAQIKLPQASNKSTTNRDNPC